MHIAKSVAALMFVLFTMSWSSVSLADGGGIEDRVNALAKARAGASGTSSQGAAAAIETMVNGRPKGSASTGHGVDAAVADIQAFRAQQKGTG